MRCMLERKENVAVLGEFSVMEVDDGITGLDVMRTELAEGREIALLLVDYIIMINMNGPEAVQRVRA